MNPTHSMDAPSLAATVDPTLAEPPLILALDIGTSSIRALLFDRLGRRVDGVEGRGHPQIRHSPPGASEADPEALLTLVGECIDAALAQAGSLSRHIAAVASDTFVNNILGLNASGQVVFPLTTYADTRSASEVERLRREFDEAETHNRTGCRFHPSYLPARLRWFHRQDPRRFAEVERWISLGEFLELRLFGEAAVSYSVAAWSGLLDRRRLLWDELLLAGLPIDRDHLSPLTDFPVARRGLASPFARRWPVLGDVPWFPAIGDGAAANIGSGCTSAARVALTVGTTSAMRAVVESDISDLPSGLWCYRVDGRRSLPGGALTEGGMVYAWMNETLRLGEATEVERALGQMNPDAHGLTLLPLFAGERSPGWAGHARATIHGLTQATTPTDILRAGLEAVAFRIALVYEQIRTLLPGDPQIVASGGALLSSPTWLQIMADVLDRPIVLSRVQEATARGVAILALEALGELDDIAAAPDLSGAAYEPDAAAHAIYRQAMTRQRHLYDMLVAG